MDHYEIIIYWSAQDQAFIADVPELPGCMAHGATHEEALSNAKQAMALWLEVARAEGQTVPSPRGHRLMYA
ncbi:MAG: type II toxin-antitoxin system HicB family antitoxin [Pseudomonadota bacterium]